MSSCTNHDPDVSSIDLAENSTSVVSQSLHPVAVIAGHERSGEDGLFALGPLIHRFDDRVFATVRGTVSEEEDTFEKV